MNNNKKEFREKFKIVWIKRYGGTEDLERSIGKDWLNCFLRAGLIQIGINYPDVWKITDKGNLYGKCHYSKGSWFFRLVVKVVNKIL